MHGGNSQFCALGLLPVMLRGPCVLEEELGPLICFSCAQFVTLSLWPRFFILDNLIIDLYSKMTSQIMPNVNFSLG